MAPKSLRVFTRHSTRVLLFGVAYFATAELGHFLTFQSPTQAFASFWPAAGLLMAVLALTPLRYWPAYLLSASTVNLLSDVLLHSTTVPVSMAYGAAVTSEACLGVWLLRKFGALPLSLERSHDVLALAAAAFLSPILGATIGGLTVIAAFDFKLWPAWVNWWFADALGIITVAPVVFAWVSSEAPQRGRISSARAVEGVMLIGGLAIFTHCIYGELLPMKLGAPALILPFLLWSVVRFGGRMVAGGLVIVAIIAVWNSAQGRGPYMSAVGVPAEAIYRIQAVLTVAILCILLMAAIIAERRRVESEHLATVARLEQTLAELRTLKELIPMCAWCHRIRDDFDGWQKIETYLRTHMQTDVTHGICPECFDAHFRAEAAGEAPRADA